MPLQIALPDPATLATEISVPDRLRSIPKPPQRLFHAGAPLEELLALPRVAIVGARSISTYGRQVTHELASQLAAHGIVIISGLALGVDSVAHQAALDVGGLTIAVLPSPIDNIVPGSHRSLARTIVAQGGALVSEYPPGEEPFKQNFIFRNRLVSGLADVVVITEASEKSGTLHTANYAFDQHRDILAIPGNITQRNAVGTNQLIKSHKAGLATSYLDVLTALGLTITPKAPKRVMGRNSYEQTVLDLIGQGTVEGQELLRASRLGVSEFNQVLTMLEISGKIRPLGANKWNLY